MAARAASQKDEVFEYIPEPTPLKAPVFKQAREGIDERPSPNPRDAQNAFQKREAMSSIHAATSGGRKREYESYGTAGHRYDAFEPPELKVANLQAEVSDLIDIVQGYAAKDGAKAATDLFGGAPAEVTKELKVLEQRLMSLARDGPAAWKKGQGKAPDGAPGPMAMPGSLVAQLESFAAGVGDGLSSANVDVDGRVTYELTYAPSATAVADSSKLAALESSIAEIEKQLGIPDPGCPFADLHTAVGQLQKRVSLLDSSKLDAISQRVKTVIGDIDKMLEKKAELEGRGKGNDDIDQKVCELYEFCHRWNAAAASLPAVVARLRSLQALHQQSASFTTRLQSLETQQEELHRLLETTNAAVHELGGSLQENMAIVRDNMRTLEAKVTEALSK